jgi:Family of unknown function (DUF6263)
MMLLWLVALLPAASVARSAEPLRWKFNVGDKFNYAVTQDMTMNVNAGPAGQMATTMKQTMDMTWNVKAVNDSGDAEITQSVDQVKLSMNMPTGQTMEYDSKSDEAPTGMAAMVAPTYDAMTKGEFSFTISPRGEISDVKVPPEVIEELKKSPGAGMMGDMASAEGFQKMIMQGSLVLPEEAPQSGESWSNTTTMNNPATGKQTIETSYSYVGTKEVNGVTMAVFKPTVKMEFAGTDMMQMKVTEQETDGEILFNVDAGRLDSSKMQQKVKIDTTIAGQTLQQQIDQLVQVKVTPAEATKATAPAGAAAE